LTSPEPSDPQDAIVAVQYETDKDLFDKTARIWAQFFASGMKLIF